MYCSVLQRVLQCVAAELLMARDVVGRQLSRRALVVVIVLQCVAVCSSVFQCAAVCVQCKLQCVTVCCSVLQCVAVKRSGTPAL